MIAKLLIANRGEIACRIIRTARRMGIATVAVHSDADAHALHVRQADEAVRIGGPLPSQSYLDGDAILKAAKATGADAVHPGYGFLSENAGFAEACAAAGITFVGPPPAAIRAMGDKAQAKAAMAAAGVPVVPGYSGDDQSLARLEIEAGLVGYPVLLKAVAGGGGRGMRRVDHPDQLAGAAESAAREAKNAFGDAALLIERLVVDARHIEVQVFADARGNTIHLGERDCSAQRRHQKVIEEAPSPFVDPVLRSRIGADAVKAAKAVGYVGAGTVEFIVAQDGSYHFLEMNTRLQVEHPVTELVTGLDLVEWQIRVARGEALPLGQEDIRLDGHAVEARLYAEDPYSGFAPQAGPVRGWRPEAVVAEGLRIDRGIADGDLVTPYYDPMIAKVIAHGRDRAEAVARLEAGLHALPVFGIANNRRFLLDLLASAPFQRGETTTGMIDGWIEDRAPILKRRTPDDESFAVAAAIIAGAGGGNWFRSTGVANCPVTIAAGDEARQAVVRIQRGRMAGVEVGGATVPIDAVEVDATQARVRIGGAWRRHQMFRSGRDLWIDIDGSTVHFVEPDPLARRRDDSDPGRVVSPVTGLVRAVAVTAGSKVEEGQLLAVVEAMKMETTLTARVAGTVRAVHASSGEQARAGDMLIEIEPG